MAKRPGEGPYHGGMGRDAIRQDRSVDSAGNKREAKRSVGEGPARGSTAPLPKASFSGGVMSRPVTAARPKRYVGG
jgi:hypothetical protein